MQIQNVPITSVKPYEKNPRFNDDAVDAVAKSIKEFGWQQPIVVDTQQLAQGLTVLRDGLRVVTTVAVDIECTITPLTIPPMTGGAKGCDALAKIIISELWMCHFSMFCLQRYEKNVIKHHETQKIS